LKHVMSANPDLSRQDAEDLIRRNDKWRERYLSVNYSARWADPSLYHLIVSVDKWDWPKLVDTLACLVQ